MVNERLAAVQARSQGSLQRRGWHGELSMATVCLSFQLMSDPPDLTKAFRTSISTGRLSAAVNAISTSVNPGPLAQQHRGSSKLQHFCEEQIFFFFFPHEKKQCWALG